MIALALGLISLVVMIATGVAASSTGGDHLAFLGVGVQTTTAQVFLTGAIFGWVFVIALWLLRVGMHRSGERCAQLAARRSRRAGKWLGFGESGAADDGWQEGDGWDEWGGWGRRTSRTGSPAQVGLTRGGWFRTAAAADADGVVTDGGLSEDVLSGGIDDRAGPTRHSRVAPGRPDRRLDQADRPLADAAEQPGPLSGGHPPGPVTGRLPGVGVDRGAHRGQIGGGPGPVPGEDRCAEGECGSGESRQ